MKDYILKPSGADRAAYLNYLLDRLTEFRKARGQHGYLNIHITRAGIKKQLAWDMDDESRFEETCAFIQGKIDNTILGRINASKGRASYHSFDSHGKPKSSVGSASDCSARSTELETHASGDDVSQTPDNFAASVCQEAGGKATTADRIQSQHEAAAGDCTTTHREFAPAGCDSFDEAVDSQPSTELVGSVAPSSASSLESRATTKSLELGAWRARTLKAARPLLQNNVSQRATADALGVSLTTLNRLVKDFASLTDDQLTPENCAGEFAERGRRSRWETFAAQETIRQKLWQLYLLSCGASADNMTVQRRTGSVAATLDVFSFDPLCPADLAEELKAGKQPKPLVNAIRQMNDLHEQRMRGQKHTSLNGSLTQRRELVEILSDGSSVPIERGDWWVFDDMSDNLPHWWEAVDGHELIGRQGLYCYDIAREWVGVEKVGTVRDSYTAAIILRFLRQLMQTFGKPRRGIVFERSVWMANTIRGVRLTTRGEIVDEDIERPAMSNEDKALLQQGIEALGLKLHYTYTPRGKEIEGAFNYLQRIKPMMAGRNGVNIGRHAGEFEHAAKQVRRVRSESHRPSELGFLHIEQSLSLDLQVMQWINERAARRNGRKIEPYPKLPALTPRDLAVFLPEKRDLEIRNVKLTALVAGVPHDFCAPELFATLGNGYRLTLAFDPSEPTLGAALYNRETSSSNFHGWQLGEFIGWADYLAPIARFDWREGDVDDPQAAMKRRVNKHVRTAFGAVGINRRVSTARDGKGNVATVTANSGATPKPVLPPPKRVVDPIAPRVTQDSYAEMFGG